MRLRTALLSALGFVAIVTAAAATERAPGAYASLTTRDAAACARACAEDGICMAWRFHRENQCQLSAAVSAQADPLALAAGYATRAPAFLHARTPVLHAAAAIESESFSEPEAPPAPLIAAEADTGELLGGPEEGDLRLGLR